MHVNIRRLRKELGLTQGQLGELVGADKSVISHWEKGRGSPLSNRIAAVAAALGVSVDELLAEAST